MKKCDLVTVYIPTKDRPNLLIRAVNSVLNQSYQNFEIIIVDDGSKLDNYLQIRDEFENEPRIMIHRFEESNGACFARNFAIDSATGVFITGLDDDDIFHPRRLEVFIEKWDERHSFLASKMTKYLKNKRRSKIKTLLQKFIESDLTVSYENHLMENQIGNQIFTKKEYLSSEKFDTNLGALQDYELWLRLLRSKGDGIVLKQRLQFIDDNHGLPRITNLERREAALKYIQGKYGLEQKQFDILRIVWKVEYQHKISFKELIRLIEIKKFIVFYRAIKINVRNRN